MPSNRIQEFFDSGNFLLVGMSKKKRNFAWEVFKNLRNADKKIYPVHPQGGEKDGVAFYRNISEIDDKLEACIICANIKNDHSLIEELARSGIRKFWLQQGSFDMEVLKKAREHDLDPLTGCAIMYLPGTSFIHRFHKFFHELLSKGQD
jgi:predicted CoA-binding protein